jgi:hypothetical protein
MGSLNRALASAICRVSGLRHPARKEDEVSIILGCGIRPHREHAVTGVGDRC